MPPESEPSLKQSDLAQLFHSQASGLTGAVRGVLGGRAEVAEILQEVFLKAWRALDKGAHPVDPVAWIFVLTLNHARDLRRKQQRRGTAVDLDDVDAMHLQSKTAEPVERLSQAEALGAARRAIGRLSDDQRDVFLMRSSAGLTFEAIAQSLGIPVGTAKTRMRAALAALRSSLAAHDPTRAQEGGLS